MTLHFETQQNSDSINEDIAETQAVGGHRRARAKVKARANQSPGKGNIYQKRRLRKEARDPLFCSQLRRSRN